VSHAAPVSFDLGHLGASGLLSGWHRFLRRLLAAHAPEKQGGGKTVKKPVIAICVGHSRQGDSGAESVSGVDEWTFNNAVGFQLHAMLLKAGYKSGFVNN
jgi:hypothetical protein